MSIPNNKKTIAIIGSGPAALMLAAQLDHRLFDVVIYEKNAAPARKFLVAGEGGFNLTHSEPLEPFIARYIPATFLERSLRAFNNSDLRRWLNTLHIETYVGSSKRVFPTEGIKPIQVLNAILKVLTHRRVTIQVKNTWKGWNSEGDLIIEHHFQDHVMKADIVVYSLGGGSWSKTGSDGSWLSLFAEHGITTLPFLPSNCAYKIEWPEALREEEGTAIKNIVVYCNDKEKFGELVITSLGLEGGAIYALSHEIRKQLKDKAVATIYLDLKPGLSLSTIKKALSNKGIKSNTVILQGELNLSKVQIALLKTHLKKEEFLDSATLSNYIKRLPLLVTDTAPLDDAISTVGGIALDEVDENFQLKKMRGHYAIGEMLDWDAPTGGYLLQASFSMGYFLARHLNQTEEKLQE